MRITAYEDTFEYKNICKNILTRINKEVHPRENRLKFFGGKAVVRCWVSVVRQLTTVIGQLTTSLSFFAANGYAPPPLPLAGITSDRIIVTASTVAVAPSDQATGIL